MRTYFTPLLLAILGDLWLTQNVCAAPSSLFFTDDEVRRIEAEYQRTPTSSRVPAKHLLHLGSILYYGPDQWTLWLSGNKWTPETHSSTIKVLIATQDSVRLSVTLQNGRALPSVELRTHQSLNLLTGTITEGY